MVTKLQPKKPNPRNKGFISGSEIVDWDYKKFEDYFMFTSFFYDEEGNETINLETWEACEQYQESSPLIKDFLNRIRTQNSDKVNKVSRSSRMLLWSIVRTIKQAIEKNPSCLSPITVGKWKYRPQFKWMQEYYNSENTVKTIADKKEEKVALAERRLDTTILDDASPSSVLIEAMGKVAQVYNKLAESITDREINSMKINDKIVALQKLSYIHTTTRKFKPNMNFIKINTKSGSAEELESALLDFNNDE